jgi:uncharacterized protein (TIGR02246 family)
MQPVARVVAIVVAVAVMGCQAASGSSASAGMADAERAAITDTATAIINGVFAAANHMKGAEFVSRFAKDSATITDNGEVAPSVAAYGASADTFYVNLKSIDPKPTAVHVRVLSPDAAFAHAPFAFTATAKNGKSVNGTGVVTALLQRQGGSWAITDYHESEADVAAMMAVLAPPASPKK